MSGTQEFGDAWNNRISAETSYLHWTRGEPQTQIQLAFRQHWLLFSEIMKSTPPKGKRCVELGAGRGTMSMYFADAGWECTLVDTSATVLQVASSAFREHGLSAETVIADATRTDLPERSFDVCVSIGLLEHLLDLKAALAEQVRLLASGGLLLAYVVPEKACIVQEGWGWLNDVLRSYYELTHTPKSGGMKPAVYRDNADIRSYRTILADLPVFDVQASGVYPLPMLSPSISFPFTLNPPAIERRLVEHFSGILAERERQYGSNPWLCDEDYGQAFLVWARKR